MHTWKKMLKYIKCELSFILVEKINVKQQISDKIHKYFNIFGENIMSNNPYILHLAQYINRETPRNNPKDPPLTSPK
jgi:hypothetical protein